MQRKKKHGKLLSALTLAWQKDNETYKIIKKCINEDQLRNNAAQIGVWWEKVLDVFSGLDSAELLLKQETFEIVFEADQFAGLDNI
mmetsp:Transcript_6685/g.7650  ORF Transcript_6685/g.7650 Transcript_6685/m.7650 type:complete len:86 (+) Transcript_6685:952-1209(+)